VASLPGRSGGSGLGHESELDEREDVVGSDDHVIEERDAQLLSELSDGVRHAAIVLRRIHGSRGVVVREDEGSRAQPHEGSEDVARASTESPRPAAREHDRADEAAPRVKSKTKKNLGFEMPEAARQRRNDVRDAADGERPVPAERMMELASSNDPFGRFGRDARRLDELLGGHAPDADVARPLEDVLSRLGAYERAKVACDIRIIRGAEKRSRRCAVERIVDLRCDISKLPFRSMWTGSASSEPENDEPVPPSLDPREPFFDAFPHGRYASIWNAIPSLCRPQPWDFDPEKEQEP
jgi:hypothetical protein